MENYLKVYLKQTNKQNYEIFVLYQDKITVPYASKLEYVNAYNITHSENVTMLHLHAIYELGCIFSKFKCMT